MAIKQITQEQVNASTVTKNMPDRPSQTSVYGQRGMTPYEIKAIYDKLPLLIVEYYNGLVESIPGVSGGVLQEGSLAGKMLTGISPGHSLKDLLGDIRSGLFPTYLTVEGDSTLADFCERITDRMTVVSAAPPGHATAGAVGGILCYVHDGSVDGYVCTAADSGQYTWKRFTGDLRGEFETLQTQLQAQLNQIGTTQTAQAQTLASLQDDLEEADTKTGALTGEVNALKAGADTAAGAISGIKTRLTALENKPVERVYRPGGSYTFNTLPPPLEDHLGLVFNLSEDFTTDNRFLEGAGKKYGAGTNVAIVINGTGIFYDVFAAAVPVKPVVTTRKVGVTLTATDWPEKRQSVAVDGLTSDEVVLVSPAPDSISACTEAGIYAVEQGTGMLTFACTTEPPAAVNINLVILGGDIE